MNSYSKLLLQMVADIDAAVPTPHPEHVATPADWADLRDGLLRAAEASSDEEVERFFAPLSYAAMDSYEVHWPTFHALDGAILRMAKHREKGRKKGP